MQAKFVCMLAVIAIVAAMTFTGVESCSSCGYDSCGGCGGHGLGPTPVGLALIGGHNGLYGGGCDGCGGGYYGGLAGLGGRYCGGCLRRKFLRFDDGCGCN